MLLERKERGESPEVEDLVARVLLALKETKVCQVLLVQLVLLESLGFPVK